MRKSDLPMGMINETERRDPVHGKSEKNNGCRRPCDVGEDALPLLNGWKL